MQVNWNRAPPEYIALLGEIRRARCILERAATRLLSACIGHMIKSLTVQASGLTVGQLCKAASG